MINVLKIRNNDQNLLDEAEAWLARLLSDQVTREDKVSFSRWLNTSEAHVKAFDDAFKLYQAVSVASQNTQVQPKQSIRIDEAAKSKNLFAALPLWLGNNAWQGVLGFVVIGVVSLFAYNGMQSSSNPSILEYSTQKGQLLRVDLIDGSHIELNTHSSVRVVYSEKERLLTLLKGEAYFSVAPNKRKPFIVNFGRGTATAIGTAFNIYRTPSATSVLVTEGTVEIKEPAELAIPNPQAIRLAENQQINIGRRGVGPIRNVDPARSLAWRENTIIFRNTPLSEAIMELNRYLEEPIRLSNTMLGHHKISGTFSLTSPEETLDAVLTVFNLHKVDQDLSSRAGQTQR